MSLLRGCAVVWVHRHAHSYFMTIFQFTCVSQWSD